MRESAAIVAELGLPNAMAAAQWQQRLGGLPVKTDDIGVVLKALGGAG